MAEEIAASVATEVAKPLVARAMTEAGYLCCFKSYVEHYEKGKSRLSATRDSVLKDIAEAGQRNENQIDDETQHWLKEAVDLIEVDTKSKKKWFFGLCTNCIWQYKRGKELAEKTLEIPELMKRRNNLVRVARSAGLPGMKYHSSPNFTHFESRKARFEEVKEALENENNHMIGLQGMGGTGKTTMVKQVGKEVEESKLFDKVIFTVVSNPPDVKKVRSSIARHLVSKLEDAKKLEEHAESLWSRIVKGGEKILIILDDVWEELNLKDIGIPPGCHEKWDELNLRGIGIPPDDHEKGRCTVLLTTRNMEVCKKMECQKTIHLELLSEDDAVNLFLLHAGSSSDGSDSDMKNMALNIAKECGGLPIAIVAVARTLKSEPLKDWEAALTRLQNFDPLLHDVDEGLTEAYKSLRLSYDHLKNEKAKQLFLLCSLFPEDFEIPIEYLSKFAIGLGFCGEADKYYIARSRVPEITHKLMDSCLLLKTKRECVKMHDLVREVAQWIANEKIQVVLDSKTTLKENIRYSSWNTNGFPNRFDGSELEFLLGMINVNGSVEVPGALFEGMMKLRVLVLICTNKSSRIPALSLLHSIQLLRNIRTLFLSNWELGDISIVGNLGSLETLELIHCLITELPNEVSELEKLRLLSLKNCEIQRNNPFNVIERCPRLEELYYVENNDILPATNEDQELHHVGTLPELRRYHIIGEKFDSSLEVDDSISGCFNPRYLRKIFSENTFKLLVVRAEILELGKHYEMGWTNFIPDIVPVDDGDMKYLMGLSLFSLPEIECLINTKHLQSDVTIFSKLVDLQLSDMHLKELCCGPLPTNFLKQLESLNLKECSKLEGTLFKGKLDLGRLRSIQLKNCSVSSLFHPSTAQSLKQLETLTICECDQLKYIITEDGSGETKVDYLDPNQKSPGSVFSDERELYQEEKEIILPSLKEMVITDAPSFIDIFPADCYRPKSSTMQKSPTVRDGLKIKDPGPSYTFSWAPRCCFPTKSSATSIDSPLASKATMPGHTASQALKTEWIINTAQCLLRQPLNPLNMREMTITHCSKLTSLFTLSIASSLLLVEKLKVGECHGLKHIVTDEEGGHDHMKYSSIFPKLQEVSVHNCSLLESLFLASHFRTLDHLVSVKISGACKLRYVFGKCGCEYNLPYQNQNVEIKLPALKDLELHDVQNMISICTENWHLTALSLVMIDLAECPQLPIRSFFDFRVGSLQIQEDFTMRKAMKMQPKNLTYFNLKDVEIDTIYDLEGLQIEGPVKLRLQTMFLENLPELRHICVGPKNILSLQNLYALRIRGCKNLKFIFSASILRSLPRLAWITVSNCNELVQIIEETEQNPVLSDQICFPELFSLHFVNCKSLKCLFSISTRVMLPKLIQVMIDDAPELVHIFGCKQGVGLQNMLSLQNLKALRITGCIKLKVIFSASILRSLPLLEWITVSNCQELVQIFEETEQNPVFLDQICFPELFSLHVDNCKSLKCLFSISTRVMLPKLIQLMIDDAPELVHIFGCKQGVGLQNMLSLQNLKALRITGCIKLKVIFSASILRSLPLLEWITVSNCQELVQIFEETEQNPFFSDQICFPELFSLHVDNCKSLKCLFSISTRVMLPKLIQLTIEDVPELVHIFGCKQGENKVMELKMLTSLKLKNVKIDKIYDLEGFQIEGPVESRLQSMLLDDLPELRHICVGLKNILSLQNLQALRITGCKKLKVIFSASILRSLPLLDWITVSNCQELVQIFEETEQNPVFSDQICFPKMFSLRVDNCKSLKCLFSISTTGILPKLYQLLIEDNPELVQVFGCKQGETKELVRKDVFPELKILKLINLPSLVTICQGIDFQSVQVCDVRDCPKVSLSSPTTKDDNIEETNSELQEGPEVQQVSSEMELPPLQSEKEATKEVVEKDLAGQEQNIYTPNLTKSTEAAANEVDKQVPISDIPAMATPASSSDTIKDGEEPSVREGLELEKAIIANQIMDTEEQSKSSPAPVIIPLQDKCLLGQIMVNETETYLDEKFEVGHVNPQQFEDDELIRLFQIIEEGADIGVRTPNVSKIAALEDDNKVAKAFSDVEDSFKMGVNEIANSEENYLRLENALNFLSTHYSEDGALAHGLKAKIDSMLQEISNILSSFKRASDRLAAIDTYTELEEKEKSINEELPQRKEAAMTIVSEIDKTKKSMVEAQQKEAELKEQISRLQAELNSKEKEIRECEIKLSSLLEQKKKSVGDTIRFLEECEAVKKDRFQIMEDKMKARQELEKVDVKWSSCGAKWRKTTWLQEIYLKQQL